MLWGTMNNATLHDTVKCNTLHIVVYDTLHDKLRILCNILYNTVYDIVYDTVYDILYDTVYDILYDSV